MHFYASPYFFPIALILIFLSQDLTGVEINPELGAAYLAAFKKVDLENLVTTDIVGIINMCNVTPAVMLLQNLARMYLAKQDFLRLKKERECAIKIQATYKGYKQRTAFQSRLKYLNSQVNILICLPCFVQHYCSTVLRCVCLIIECTVTVSHGDLG